MVNRREHVPGTRTYDRSDKHLPGGLESESQSPCFHRESAGLELVVGVAGPVEAKGWREMGVSPDRCRPSLRTEMVSVGPVGESPIMTDRGTKIAEWGHIVVIRPVPPRESSWLLHLWD